LEGHLPFLSPFPQSYAYKYGKRDDGQTASGLDNMERERERERESGHRIARLFGKLE
jgi:hypothetical protein